MQLLNFLKDNVNYPFSYFLFYNGKNCLSESHRFSYDTILFYRNTIPLLPLLLIHSLYTPTLLLLQVQYIPSAARHKYTAVAHLFSASQLNTISGIE